MSDIFETERETHRKILYQERNLTLYHYFPKSEKTYETPIILVPPLMVPSNIFDLLPEHSMANTLVENGFNVYLIDFGEPDIHDSNFGIDIYIFDILYRAIYMVKKHLGVSQVSLLGYCLGGTFSIIYASASLEIKDDVKNVISISGPLDSKSLKFYSKLFKPYKNFWNRLVESNGFLPREIIILMFEILNISGLLKRTFNLIKNTGNKHYLRRHKAISTFYKSFLNLPETSYKQIITAIDENSFINGKLILMKVIVNLANFSANLLTISGSRDNFIPSESVNSIHKYISVKDAKHIEVPLGHLSIMYSEEAKENVWNTCVNWLKDRSGTLGKKEDLKKSHSC